ncbi:MAG: Xaa-Pro peptidase family protein [Phycisphaerales bacterium]
MPATTPAGQRLSKSERQRRDRYRARLKRVRAEISDAGCDALLITDPSDIRYLTPFSGEDSCAIVLPTSLIVVSDRRFEEELWSLKGIAKVVLRKGPMVGTLGPLMSDHDVTYAFQADRCTFAMRTAIAKHVGAKSLVPVEGLMTRVRAVKDDAELRSIKKAIRLQEDALEATLDQIGPGTTESEVAALLEYEMRALGAEGAAFDIIAAAGPNGSKAHYRPARTKLRAGGSLLIDWGAVVDGYRSDMTRTFSFGRWGRELSKVYDVVLEAFHAGVDAIAPGVTGKEADEASREVIRRAGYAKRFGHSLGHGIGLDIHEMPSLSAHSDWVLREGHVVTVEPGIYLPGVGGVRLENDILVTSRGVRDLCSLPMDKGWATL